MPPYNNGEVNPISVLNRFLQLLGLKVQPITSGTKKQDKAIVGYQLDRALLDDGRADIFKVWQTQQSRELLRSA